MRRFSSPSPTTLPNSSVILSITIISNITELYTMHRTATGEKIKAMKAEAARAEMEAATLAKVRGLEEGAVEREEEARRLRGEAEDLKPKARLEDLSVYQVTKEKTMAKGEARTYKYWYASWWEGDRARNVYLGSAAKLSEEAALGKARKMKAEALELDL